MWPYMSILKKSGSAVTEYVSRRCIETSPMIRGSRGTSKALMQGCDRLKALHDSLCQRTLHMQHVHKQGIGQRRNTAKPSNKSPKLKGPMAYDVERLLLVFQSETENMLAQIFNTILTYITETRSILYFIH